MNHKYLPRKASVGEWGEGERRQLVARLAALEEENREMEAFSYTIAHDLRAPLRAIDGHARQLEAEATGQLSAEDRRFVGVIREQAGAMRRMLDDLLAFSLLVHHPVRKRHVAPESVVKSVLETLYAGESARAEVVVHPLPACDADPSLIRQVWANLLSNAFKFSRTRACPRIEIGGRFEANDVGPLYWVRDNGVGFDTAQSARLFGIFQRLHTQREFEGTGIGLSVVQRIVLRHGGRVWAAGQVGGGATFYFSLPDGNTNDGAATSPSKN